MEKVAIADLVSEQPRYDRQDRFIHKILNGLINEGHTDLEKLTFASWVPILSPDHPNHLYLILSGNASVAFAAKSGGDVSLFTETLADIPRKKNPVAELTAAAVAHPLVLCKGDLVGEFEYVQKRDPLSHVIAGTFFKAPETRKRLQTTVVRLPARSAFAETVSLHAMTEKLVLLNHLLLPCIHRRQARINHILACCFAGLFPVYRAFYSTEDGKITEEMPDPCVGIPNDKDSKPYAGLGRLNPTRNPVAIEISTSYLMRCFGLSPQAIDMDVDGHELDWYSDKKKHESIDHLGAESLLFFLRRKTAQKFCSKYGIDLQQEALAAIP